MNVYGKVLGLGAILIWLVGVSCNSREEVLLNKELQTKIDSLIAIQNELIEDNKLLNSRVQELLQQRAEQDLEDDLKPVGDVDKAVEAIVYHLKMYHPKVKYSDIRGVLKTDNTVDVIVDVNDNGSDQKYYTVATFSNSTYRIISEHGWF
jgi:hypothetical protein